jgi:hypothetical protein
MYEVFVTSRHDVYVRFHENMSGSSKLTDDTETQKRAGMTRK